MRIGCFLLVFILLGGIGYGGWTYYNKTHRPAEWGTEAVDEGEIRQLISATGSLAAVKTVDVGSQISGILASVSVDFNDQVHAGQQIAQIEDSTFQSQVQQATANLENARASERNAIAQIENLKASLINAKADEKMSQANLKKAEFQVEDAQRNFKRSTELFQKKLISQSDLDSAQTNLDTLKAGKESAAAQVEVSHAKQASILAQIDSAKAQAEGAKFQIKQMEALLNTAQINLSRTKIYSPIDGVVILRNVDVGQTVAASLQAPVLFSIANDLREMQINTAVDEADIGKVKEGQTAQFTVDAYRGRSFEGKVAQVRLSPTITQNVVTYSVMVNLKNDDLALKPGMTANVEILVDYRPKALRIPARALFFKPSPKSGLIEEGQGENNVASDSARIWVKRKREKPTPLIIKTGLANNQYAEVIDGKLQPGDSVVIEEKKAGEGTIASGPSANRTLRRLAH